MDRRQFVSKLAAIGAAIPVVGKLLSESGVIPLGSPLRLDSDEFIFEELYGMDHTITHHGLWYGDRFVGLIDEDSGTLLCKTEIDRDVSRQIENGESFEVSYTVRFS